jgi:hypothetical protein
MERTGIEEIARELCDLLDQQMKAISGRGLEDLTDEELANYERRRTRLATLRSELAKFAHRA